MQLLDELKTRLAQLELDFAKFDYKYYFVTPAAGEAPGHEILCFFSMDATIFLSLQRRLN